MKIERWRQHPQGPVAAEHKLFTMPPNLLISKAKIYSENMYDSIASASRFSKWSNVELSLEKKHAKGPKGGKCDFI